MVRASECDQCIGQGVDSWCDHWVVDMLVYLKMKYPTPLISLAFGNLIPTI